MTVPVSRTMRALAIDATIVSVVRGLTSAGVASLLLKGPSIERWLYDAHETRISGDVDLLVAPGDGPAAERRLQEMGYVNKYDGPSPTWAEEHADLWSPGENAMPVDLHRRIWGVGASPAQTWDKLYGGRDELLIGDVHVSVMGPTARTLIVALHAAHHGPGFAQPLDDLQRALDREDVTSWRSAADLARELDAVPGLSAGLALLGDGAVLRDRLGLPRMERDVVVRTASMWSEPATAMGFLRLFEAGSSSEKLTLLRRELVPSREFMTARIAGAPRRGGLPRAYVRRWRRLALDAPAGLRAARAIRRRHEPPPPQAN